MPLLLITVGSRATTLPLAASTLIGRAPGCLARVDDDGVPAHWLEIRYRGEEWAWRVLAAEDRTRGSGAVIEPGWRRMDAGEGRGTRVSLGRVSVELVAGGPPEPFVWDLLADRALTGEALEQLVEVRGDALIPLSAEGDAAAALRDGQVWLHPAQEEGAPPRVLRAHLPTPLPLTRAATLDLALGGVTAEIDRSTWTLTLSRGPVHVEIRSACVRSLAVYATARAAGGGGWMSAVDAWAVWSELGGPGDAPVDAVAWERGRLRRLLDKAGVSNLQRLVEHRKDGRISYTRLSDAIIALRVA